MNEEQLPRALLIDDNLLTSSRVASALRDRFDVKVSRALEGEAPQVVIINLGSRTMAGVELITTARERFPLSRVVGFCGHKEVEIRRAAKSANILKIYTNDDAHSGLPGLELL